jgi:hypothetical protein
MVNNSIAKLEPLLGEVHVEGEKTECVDCRRMHEEAEHSMRARQPPRPTH